MSKTSSSVVTSTVDNAGRSNMASDHEEDKPYQPKDALSQALRGTLICGGAGAFVGAARVALTRQNIGAWAVVTRTGGFIGLLGVLVPFDGINDPNANSST